jgi:hypothetical protein
MQTRADPFAGIGSTWASLVHRTSSGISSRPPIASPMKPSAPPIAKPVKAGVPIKKPVRVRPVPGVTRAIAILRLLGRSPQST